MADNYLEKKMEEHRKGTAQRTHKLTPTGHKPGYAILPYTIDKAFIKADSPCLTLESIARAIRETGCRVALSCPDGSLVAQRLSCAYVPEGDNALSLIAAKWGEIKLLIEIVSDGEVTLALGRGTSVLKKSENCTDEEYARRAAELCVYLSLPDSDGRVFGEFII